MHHNLTLKKVSEVDYSRTCKFWDIVRDGNKVGEISTYGKMFEVFDAQLNKLHASVTLKAAFRTAKGIL